MSLLDKFSGLAGWQKSALDLPVPDDLVNGYDRDDWEAYSGMLPPARLVKKFGEAVDAFQDAAEKMAREPLPFEDRKILYSYCMAANIMAGEVTKKLGYMRSLSEAETSNMADGISFVVDLTEGLNAPEAEVWRVRAKRQQAIDGNQELVTRLDALLEGLALEYFDRQSGVIPRP